MGEKYLIDTNVVIDFCADVLPQKGSKLVASIIDTAPTLSVINKIELLSHATIPKSIQTFLTIADITPLDYTIVLQTIAIRQKYRIKLPDAIIAATALVHKKILITRNTKDFLHIEQLQVLNPHS